MADLCPKCGGDCHIDCRNCGGSGEVPARMRVADIQGIKENCHVCEGTGKETCPICHGDGYVR